MSETGLAVLGGGLWKISIFNTLLAQSRVSRACVSKTQQPSVGCQEFALAGIAGSVRLRFSLLECTFSAEFGAIRRTVFGVFRRYSALFGVFRRVSAHAHGEINRAVFVCPRRMFRRVAGGASPHLAMVLILEHRVCQKAFVLQTELLHRKRRA